MANTKSVDFEVSSDQRLSISNANLSPEMSGNFDFSAEFWINIESLPSVVGSNYQVMHKYGAYGWMFRFDSNDVVTMYVKGNDGSGNRTGRVSSANVVLSSGDIGNWLHFACTVDVSAGIPGIKLYKNGAEITNTTDSGSDFATSLGNDSAIALGIGGKAAGTQSVDGKMDEVILWRDVRTASEISDGYNSGDGKVYDGTEQGMMGYWRMEDDFTDLTANGNDLSNNNAATFSTDVPFSGGPSPSSFISQIIMS